MTNSRFNLLKSSAKFQVAQMRLNVIDQKKYKSFMGVRAVLKVEERKNKENVFQLLRLSCGKDIKS